MMLCLALLVAPTWLAAGDLLLMRFMDIDTYKVVVYLEMHGARE